MIPNDRLRSIAGQLLEKARADQVAWKRVGDGEGGFDYVVQLPQSQIRVWFASPATAPDRAAMVLCNQAGIKVGEMIAEAGEPDFDLLSSLYAEADRSFTGWDKVLGDIERAVKAEGTVGQGEDLPF
jgi:hypothetical protein